MKYLIIVLVALSMAVPACKKDKHTKADTGITGNWRWVLSMGGIAGIRETPASTSHNLHYVFSGTSTCKIISDSNTVNTTYAITTDTSFTPGQVTNFMTIGGQPYGIVRCVHDSLFLSSGYVDGYDYYFVRE